MLERGPDTWRLQVAADPDLVTGGRRRLSRTFHGTRAEAKEALQRMVVETGAGLWGGGTPVVGDLLDQFMATCIVAPTTRQDWEALWPGTSSPPSATWRCGN